MNNSNKDGSVVLDSRLIEKQKLNQDDIDKIIALHENRHELFELMSSLDSVRDNEQLRKCVGTLETIEFAMQKRWKFPQDKDYHTWWFRAPHCSCPKMDNADILYFGRRIIMEKCPLHGTQINVSEF